MRFGPVGLDLHQLLGREGGRVRFRPVGFDPLGIFEAW